MRARQPRLAAAPSAPGTCSGTLGAATLGGVDAADVNDAEDDVLHKVHVMLHTRMDTIRVQVPLILQKTCLKPAESLNPLLSVWTCRSM